MVVGGAGDRMTNIRFCVLEALMELNTELLQCSVTMALMHDERQGKLLLRGLAPNAQTHGKHTTRPATKSDITSCLEKNATPSGSETAPPTNVTA